MDEPEAVFGRCRFALAHYFKYLASLVYSTVPVFVENIDEDAPGPIGVDTEWRIYYGPKFLTFSLDEQVALLYHEIAGHLLRGHSDRAAALGISADTPDKQILWNLASDCSINDEDPIGHGKSFPFPEWAIKPSKFGLQDHEIEEWYYDKILRSSKVLRVNVGCGSGSGGKTEPYELSGPAVRGVSKIARELLRQHTAEQIADHESRSPGTVPGDLKRWAELHLSPKVDWRRELRAGISRELDMVRGRNDYSYTKPSRRSLPWLILPGMVETVPRGGIVIDTSGSMGQADLDRAITEVDGILRQVLPEAPVFITDASVHSVKTVNSVHQIVLSGGGGTDMGAGIQAAERHRPSLDFVVVITDGETPWPESPPVLPVVIALVQKPICLLPSWGKSVECF